MPTARLWLNRTGIADVPWNFEKGKTIESQKASIPIVVVHGGVICRCRIRAGEGRARSHGVADRGAQATNLYGAGRAQGQAAGAVRGQGAQGSAQCRHRADRRHRLRRVQHVRRSYPHADHGPACPVRPALQQLPHHGAVLTDTSGAQIRPEPSLRQCRLDHGDRDGLPRQHRADSALRLSRKCCG
jgi:hypothetical protein